MTREQIFNQAASQFADVVNPMAYGDIADFAIEIYNQALEEAANETTNSRVRHAIRALRINP